MLTRQQLRLALDVEKLHASTVERLQDAALKRGCCIVDLDDLFPCIEIDVLRKYRRPPKTIFNEVFDLAVEDDEEDESLDELDDD